MIAPDNGSTAVFEITDDVTNEPVMALIENEQSGREIMTDEAGKGEMGHLPQGSTKFNITADGFTQQSVTQTMNGTRTIIRVRMDKVSTAAQGAEAMAVPGSAETTGG